MKIYGLIGEKLGHSLSPFIHQSLFDKMDILASYGLFEVSRNEVKNIVASMRCLGIKGLNVTIPYKEEVIPQVDELSEEAKKIGAINTLYNNGEKIIGYNTDYIGFGKALVYGGVEIENRTFYVLGGGGSAKSIIWYLKDHGAEVILVSRNPEESRLKFKRENIQVINYSELKKVSKAYAVVNTTPCGMYPNVETIAIDAQQMETFEVAVDIVYNPVETQFLKIAKVQGLKTVGGVWMLVAQGMVSQSIWQQQGIDESYEKQIYKEVYEELTKRSM